MKTKKALALLIVFAISVIGVFADEPNYLQDFQNETVYSGTSWGQDVDNGVAGLTSGSGHDLISGELTSSSVFGGIWWQSYYAIENEYIKGNTWNSTERDTGSNVLCIKANDNNNKKLATMNVVKNLGSLEDGFEYSVDMRAVFDGKFSPVSGIRLAQKNNETNYYELAFVRAQNASYTDPATIRFTKNTNAAETDVFSTDNTPFEYINNEGTAANGLVSTNYITNGTQWFNLKITEVKGLVTYCVTEKATNTQVYKATFDDTEKILSNGFVPQMFSTGSNCATYFDNITISPVVSENTNTLTVFSDNIEDYTLYDTSLGLGDSYNDNTGTNGIASGSDDWLVAGVWKTSQLFGGTSWQSDYRIQYAKQYANLWNQNDPDTENKVIALKPTASKIAALNLVADYGDVSDGFIFSADVRNYFDGIVPGSTGIRLVDKDDESNYYELSLLADYTEANQWGVNGTAKAPRFAKVTGGVAATTNYSTADSDPAYTYVEKAPNVIRCDCNNITGTGFKTDWLNLLIAMKEKTVSWQIKDSNGDILWRGSKVFDEEIDETKFIPQLYTYEDNGTYNPSAYFDNIKIIKCGIALNKFDNESVRGELTLVGASNGSFLITAYYRADGTLISVTSTENDTGDIINRNIAFNLPGEAASIKTFIVDNFADFRPLVKAGALTLQ